MRSGRTRLRFRAMRLGWQYLSPYGTWRRPLTIRVRIRWILSSWFLSALSVGALASIAYSSCGRFMAQHRCALDRWNGMQSFGLGRRHQAHRPKKSATRATSNKRSPGLIESHRGIFSYMQVKAITYKNVTLPIFVSPYGKRLRVNCCRNMSKFMAWALPWTQHSPPQIMSWLKRIKLGDCCSS